MFDDVDDDVIGGNFKNESPDVIVIQPFSSSSMILRIDKLGCFSVVRLFSEVQYLGIKLGATLGGILGI
jgi:hypothetical protein